MLHKITFLSCESIKEESEVVHLQKETDSETGNNED